MGVVFKGIKNVAKGIGKVVKGVAKGIKNLGKGIVKGVKGAFKGIGKVMGKLGPIGSIALMFVLPGIGAALGGMWTGMSTAMTSYVGFGQTVVNAVGAGMQWAANAATYIKELPGKMMGKLGETSLGQTVKGTYKSVTDKMASAFEYVGGSVKEGAANMWQSAKEFVGMPGEKAGMDVGSIVGKGAEKSMVNQAVNANPEFLKMANSSGVSVADIARANPSTFISPDIAGPISGTQSFNALSNPELAGKAGGKVLGEQAAFLTKKTGADVLANNPEFLQMAGGDINKATALANQQSNFVAQRSGTAAAANFSGQAKNVKDMGIQESSMLDQIKKAMPNFKPSPIPQAASYIAPVLSGDEIQNTDANRFGVGGQGSAGGSFLDPSILAMIQQQQKQLEAQG